VKREGRRWYVVLSCHNVPARPLPATGAVTGIDMGVASFLTTSEGEHVPNPRHLATSADRLAKAQQALCRCKRRSNRRRKVRERVAAVHRKIRRQRLDHAHKTALALVRDHDLASCHGNVQCIVNGAPAAIAALVVNLSTILREIQRAAPGASVVLLGALDVNIGAFALTHPLIRVASDYGAMHVPKSNSLMLPFTNVMCWVTLTLSTRPVPFATTCNWPVNVAWNVPCCAFSVAPNHSVPRML